MTTIRLTAVIAFTLVGMLLSAAQAKTIARMDGGMTSVYWQVPDDFNCDIQIPDLPNVFCENPNGVRYYQAFLGTIQGAPNPDQPVSQVLQKIAAQYTLDIVKQYRIPQVTRHLLQLNTVFSHTQGEQARTYAFDARLPDSQEVTTFLLVVSQLPNNGAPVTNISLYGVSAPSTRSGDFDNIRRQFLSALLSTELDNNYIQTVNAAQARFVNNLRARESNFYTTQNRIHQNNMNALDSLQQSYQRNSAASDRMQRQTIDSIHDTRRMVDPQTGQQYQVDGYGDHVWVNPSDPGTSVQTDNALLNPNINTEQGLNFNQLEEYRY